MLLQRRLSKAQEAAVLVLLMLAALHCTRSIFFENVSWVNLQLYAAGQERNPFQERVAMMPLLRAASRSIGMQKAAAAIDREDRHQLGRRSIESAEPMSPEKLACLLVGSFCNLIAVVALFLRGKKFGLLQWLPAALFLVILYVSYAARYEEAYWYPYDLPHLLLFGAACMCLLDGPLLLFFPLFALDLPMRETSIFLILVAAPVLWQRWKHVQAAGALIAMAAVWLAVHLAIAHAFAGNASETGSRLVLNLKNMALPLHWPQMVSVLGFLLLPVFMGRAYLTQAQRRFLYLMVPCLCVTAWYGIWIESRIALEWSIPLAYLATVEIAVLAEQGERLE